MPWPHFAGLGSSGILLFLPELAKTHLNRKKTRRVCTRNSCHTVLRALVFHVALCLKTNLAHCSPPPPRAYLQSARTQPWQQWPLPPSFLSLSTNRKSQATSAKTRHLCWGRSSLAPPVCAFWREGERHQSLSIPESGKSTESTPIRTDLNSTSAFGRALAYVVESCVGWLVVTVFASPTQVNYKRFVLEQAHQVRRLLTLPNTDLNRPDRS